MRVWFARAPVLLTCVWLAGCGTSGLPGSGEATGSVNAPPPPGAEVTTITGGTPASTGMSGEEPQSDLQLGKRYYRENQFGNAEKHFRRAVELAPRDLEAWIGLAAAYDKLKRFDLADRAYNQAIRLAGPTPEILNNQGYSYMLRGDRRRARQILLAARAKDPKNPYIQNNLDMLDESFARRKDSN